MEKIKIAHQEQANESIYLLKSGKVVCGNYQYNGKMKKEFQDIFSIICDLTYQQTSTDTLDVSSYSYWNAMNIYEERLAKKWKKSISAKELEKLAIETEVFLMLEVVKEEFKRAVSAKWKRINKISETHDPSRPTQGWHLFRKS